jgi:hypothetical protein
MNFGRVSVGGVRETPGRWVARSLLLIDQKFLNWDIPMSTIVHANEADATAAMASGQMVAKPGGC